MKTLLSIFSLLLLSSCSTHRLIMNANGNTYYDQEAIIAYDMYNELYNNNVYDKKPILIENNIK